MTLNALEFPVYCHWLEMLIVLNLKWRMQHFQ